MWLNEKCNVILYIMLFKIVNRLQIIKYESKMLYAI